LAFGVGGLAADQVFRKIFQKAQSAAATQTQQRWAELGRSMGIYSVVFSLMWAMPFVRNYVTAKRTGRVRFTEVIEANKHQESDGRHEHKNALQETMAYYRNRVLTILGLGGAVAAGSVGLTRWAASSKEISKDFLHTLSDSWIGKNLLLKGGEFARFGGWAALLFWGVPAYGGWLHASRDPYEKKEQLLKFGNFVACFFGPSIALQAYFSRKLKGLNLPDVGGEVVSLSYDSIQKAKQLINKSNLESQTAILNQLHHAESLWLKKSALGLVSSIVLLGTMPQLINIHLTKRRLQRDSKMKPAATRRFEKVGIAYGRSSARQATVGYLPQASVGENARKIPSQNPSQGSPVSLYAGQYYPPLAAPVKPFQSGTAYAKPLPTCMPGAQFWRSSVF
jgi:hypothetical protein